MSRNARSSLTIDDLRRLSESPILYEFEMLSPLAHRLVRVAMGERGERYEDNAFLESFLLHARQVTDVLYESSDGSTRKSPSRPHAEFATDYFDNRAD